MSNNSIPLEQPDIYGQRHPIESPLLLNRKLKEFEEELLQIPDKKKAQFLVALEECPELLTDDFKLSFLRCDVFNADLAAARFAKYWNRRIEVFGPDRGFKPLTFENCLPGDMDKSTFACGIVTPIRTGGRLCYYANLSKSVRGKVKADSFAKCIWFFSHVAMTNMVAQKRGIVVIASQKTLKLREYDRGLLMAASSLNGVIPLRISAYHVCHPAAFIKVMAPLVNMLIPARLRKRFHIHKGSDEEVLSKLAKYGCEKKDIPTDLGGDYEAKAETWLDGEFFRAE